MEGREPGDPGYDDWFDEPEPLTETQSGVTRGVYDDGEEVWVLPEDEAAPEEHEHREFVLFGRTLTLTQIAIIAACVLALFFAILAAAGVFSTKPAPPPVTTITTPTTPAVTTPPATTTPTTPAPTQTLSPGDTGQQVKVLQEALNALGYSVGKPDGVYGPATQSAVEKFQSANDLAADGIVGEQTLSTLRQALASQ